MKGPHTRLAVDHDAAAIATIYNLEVLDSTVTMDLVARTLAEQREWVRRHQGAHPAIVAVSHDTGTPARGADTGATDDGGRVVGFASLSPWRDRPAYRGTVENSVYVERASHGQGIGRLLLTEILRLATESGFHACMARIAGGNEPSVRLHRSCGFELVGIERQVGRKFNRWIDVTLMERLL